MKKHQYNDLFAGLAMDWNNRLIRVCWHGELDKAIEYAKNHLGIIAIEHIIESDKPVIVWER